MKSKQTYTFAVLMLLPILSFGQAVQVFRDLESMQPVKLTKDELKQILPGAKITRVNAKGNTHIWTNEEDGSFIVSNDNRATSRLVTGHTSSAPGKWHISDDGRYCVLIEWKTGNTEEWCRYIYKTTDGYYSAKSDMVGTEKVFKLDISGK